MAIKTRKKTKEKKVLPKPKKTSKKRVTTKSRHHATHVGVLRFLLFLAFGIFIYQFLSFQTHAVVETPRNDVKKLPKDIKEKFAKDATASASLKIPILMYHYVEYVQDKKDKTRVSLNINPDVFDSQIKTLHDAGYHFLTAGQLNDMLKNKKVLPPKPVVITIDDGHWDLDTVILPILKKYNARATAYIIPGFIGGSDFLTDAQLKDVINSKIVEIGAHTVHHVYLKGAFLPIVKYEVNESKTMLEKNYGIKVVSFAYPSGGFDEQAIKVVKDAGFTSAVSTVLGNEQNPANLYFLFRIRPGYRTGNELLNYIDENNLHEFK
ncbi:MAG TPA: polysaccharide deacetylase family protein [Patescibacteria group bacterium]|nr:polysaccharide deacetylase family protein [Patescibacteria group bacterium]